MRHVARLILALLAMSASLLAVAPAGAANADLAINISCSGFSGNGATASETVTWKVRVARWADGNYASPPTDEAWYEGHVAAGQALSASDTWASRGITIVSGSAASATYYWWWIYDSAGAVIKSGEGHFDCTPPPPPPPSGGEGCTPGYWKQTQHFDSWVGYAPSGSFEAAVGRDLPGSPTMLDALNARGGGLSALMRHTAAALLNTGGVDYAFTNAQVVSMFQAAFDSGNYEPTKDRFDAANNAGCPLN